MSEFWKRKVRKYFSTFDLDGDGVISKDDFVGMAITFANFEKADKQKAEHLKTQFENERLLGNFLVILFINSVQMRCSSTTTTTITSTIVTITNKLTNTTSTT